MANVEQITTAMNAADMPVDLKWRALMMYFVSMDAYDFLSKEQRSQIKVLLFSVLKEKNYSDENFRSIVMRHQNILNAPWKNEIKSAFDEALGRVQDFKYLLEQRTDNVRVLKEETVKTVEGENSLETMVEDVKSGFNGLISQMEADAKALVELSMTDSLTKLNNRRAFDTFIASWLVKSKAKRVPLALLMLDIDYFKKFNDDYGHRIGDQALATVASIINGVGSSVSADRSKIFMPARFGGEEFVVLLVGFRGKEVLDVAEELRKRLAGYNFILRNLEGEIIKNGIQITVSIGAAKCLPEWISPDSLIEAADQALYSAKRSGRNRVCVYRPS